MPAQTTKPNPPSLEEAKGLLSLHREVLVERFGVKALSVFGSVARGDARPDSDLDVLVSYARPPGLFAFLELKEYLEAVLSRPVDLVTDSALKKQLRDGILKEAVRVH